MLLCFRVVSCELNGNDIYMVAHTGDFYAGIFTVRVSKNFHPLSIFILPRELPERVLK